MEVRLMDLVCLFCISDPKPKTDKDERLTVWDGQLVCLYHIKQLQLLLKENDRRKKR
jgi:hypothetical protein